MIPLESSPRYTTEMRYTYVKLCVFLQKGITNSCCLNSNTESSNGRPNGGPNPHHSQSKKNLRHPLCRRPPTIVLLPTPPPSPDSSPHRLLLRPCSSTLCGGQIRAYSSRMHAVAAGAASSPASSCWPQRLLPALAWGASSTSPHQPVATPPLGLGTDG
ncbi:hypothetical protein BS78_04G293000 [Paspalum vaginatum]|nr:hypothetical protein BS78_04G293000 [Paspalum vaginatum]